MARNDLMIIVRQSTVDTISVTLPQWALDNDTNLSCVQHEMSFIISSNI